MLAYSIIHAPVIIATSTQAKSRPETLRRIGLKIVGNQVLHHRMARLHLALERSRATSHTTGVVAWGKDRFTLSIESSADVEASKNGRDGQPEAQFLESDKDRPMSHKQNVPKLILCDKATRANPPTEAKCDLVWIRGHLRSRNQEPFWTVLHWVGIHAFLMRLIGSRELQCTRDGMEVPAHHAPLVGNHHGSSGDEHPVVHLDKRLSDRTGNQGVSSLTSSSINRWGTPIGMTTSHRNASFATAVTYGNDSRSAKVGSRSVPITRSSSSWASLTTCGVCIIPRTKVSIDDRIVSAAAAGKTTEDETLRRNPRVNKQERTSIHDSRCASDNMLFFLGVLTGKSWSIP